MKYADPRFEVQFYGDEVDPRLRAICLELDLWLTQKFNKEMLMTGLLRTPEEQAAIYPDNPTKPSPHLDRPCRAADFRRTHLEHGELITLVGYFAQHWGAHHSGLLLVDDRGPAHPHLHIAVYKMATIHA